jgi:mRNA-degrading endonuclease toxin of MazEF toxin-antitoxin module
VRERRSIKQGAIFWLDDCPTLEGDVLKRRPVVVIAPPQMLATEIAVVPVVACTTTHNPRTDPDAIELPGLDRNPGCSTGLKTRSWLIPRWLVPVPREKLTFQCGYISRKLLHRAVQAIEIRRTGI